MTRRRPQPTGPSGGDRLSRSLADFARLMQVFDQHRVSFVSVTQQFNTTTSMGRLTLNMLLSFAQFEREVAGERIRDKIAATKRRGVWVCGRPPLGYAIDRSGPERALRIVDAEADLVRSIYAGYLELGSLVGLAMRLAAQGHLTRRVEGREGRSMGGRRFTTSDLHRILTNPLYVGRITHRRRADGVVEVHPGVHEPIVDQATWDAVRARMDRPTPRTPGAWTHTHLLKGKIRTAQGAAMSPGSTHRPRSKRAGAQAESRPVRYYVSQQAIRHGFAACPIKNLNARHIDDLVRALVLDHARRAHRLDLAALGPTARDHHVRALVEAVEVDADRLVLVLDESAVHDAVDAVREARRASGNRTASGSKQHEDTVPTCPFQPRIQAIDTPGGPRTKLVLDVQLKRLDGRRVLLAPDGRDLLSTVTSDGEPVPRPHLVRALAQAHRWRERLVRLGHSVEDIARDEGITAARVSHIVPLAYLPPETTRAALTGTLPESVTLGELMTTAASG